MKKFLAGVVGAIALALSISSAAQAQSFELFPSNECDGVVVRYVCRGRMPSGEPLLYSIPTGFNGNYLLTGLRISDNNNVFYVIDNRNDQILAYVYMDDDGNLIPSPSNVGIPSISNPGLLAEITSEIVYILGELRLY